jgi:transposase
VLSTNNNHYDYNERERQVIELYNQGKSTRDIARELRMSLRDISIILRNNQVSHGSVTTITKDNENNKSPDAHKLTNYFLKVKSHLK